MGKTSRKTIMGLRSLLLCAALLGAGAPQSLVAQSLPAAFEAAAKSDWPTATSQLPQSDVLTQDLLIWTWLRAEGSTAPFAVYRDFLARRSDWPGLDRLRAQGERVIPTGTPAAEVIAFFAEAKPQTGEGAVKLINALSAKGDNAGAEAMLRDVWRTVSLTEEGQAALLAAYGRSLGHLHSERVDTALWAGRIGDASAVLDLAPARDKAAFAARIAMQRGAGDADRLYSALSAGDYTEAGAFLLARTGSAASLGQPARWAGGRGIVARWLMREGEYGRAYDLARQHHLTAADGETFADLEWLAGYIALRFLADPASAITHFDAMARAVSGPISMSRAGYWLGRAHERRGDQVAASAAYAGAAEFQTAFYGLLAAERLGLSLDPALAGREVFPDWRQAAFVGSEKTRAALTLLSAGQRSGAVQFFLQLARSLDRTELGQLDQILAAMNEPFFRVLVAKTALDRGILIPAAYFPIHPLAEMDLPVERELALAIARRESEFNATVASPVGALGLMQVMPGTAEMVSKDLGLSYDKWRLVNDWEYNVTLGSQYLADLEERFGPSPVMIAAGYNAGPRRPQEWMDARGDPRQGQIDVVDWIEMIPFKETRNYVQRVTEAIPIYRARLSGQTGTIRFAELLIGEKPLIRPRARPAPPVTLSEPSSPTALGTSPRPLARP
ncbi:MAG: lytic transglycosylase domain-containing protein [Rhodobacteraceae bacterium]|nr:lytic transglycosylase domain-containing protein [Paracoccaceae bacterium]